MAYICYNSVCGLLQNGSQGKGPKLVCSKPCATLHQGGFAGLLQRQRTVVVLKRVYCTFCRGWYMAPLRRQHVVMQEISHVCVCVCGDGWFNLCTLIAQSATGVQPAAGSHILHLPVSRLEPAHHKPPQHLQRCNYKARIITTKKTTSLKNKSLWF